eukprot:TRINITY_DN7811_c0_g1_i1.p1 TRINITY_DN7811_c0_g1~~TRINITY_DN7811_c0_g1_i1.p1  ORF type:complete len:146 (-),score=18.57 TRINITY_DN7811_c0_g1_i1:181-618(-)
MADVEDHDIGPVGPVIDVIAMDISPEGESAFEDGLGLAISFSTDTTLVSYHWNFTYMVDTSKRRKIIDIGSTPVTDYLAGGNSMTFSCPPFSAEFVPEDVRASKNGLISAILTGPDGAEAMTVTMVVQVTPGDAGLRRTVISPLA